MSDGKIIYDVEVNDDGIESKVQGTNSKIQGAANSGSNAFSEVWTGALRRIGAGLVELGGQAVDAAKQVAMDALDQVSQLEQNVGGVQKLFGDNAQAVIDNANHAFVTAGMSANQYMETVTGFSASLIAGLGGDTEKAVSIADRAITDMSDNANTFGTDISSIQVAYQGFAKQNYTMLDNLKLGYGGTKEEMSRLIADASQMTDEMEKLGVSVDADSMSFDNIINAISVMQEHLNIAGTTAKEASGTIEGSVNSMKAAWDNFLAGTLDGESLAEIAYDAMDNIYNAFMEIIPRLTEGLATFIPLVGEFGLELAQNLITTVAEQAPAMLEQGLAFIENLGQGIADNLPSLLEQGLQMLLSFTDYIHSNAGTLVDAGISFITNLVTGIAKSLPTLVRYVPTIVSNVANTISDNMPKILKAGVNLIKILLQGIVETIPTLIAEFPKIIQMIFDVWEAIEWLNLGKFLINGIWNGIKLLATNIPTLVKSIGKNAWELFKAIDWKSLGTNLINLAKNGITGLATAIPNALKSVGKSAMSAFKSIDWKSLGSAVISGIKTGIKNGAAAIIEAAKDVAQAALDAAKSFLGIHSPSRVFKEQVGEQISAGEAEGITENSDLVTDAVKDVQENALDASMDVNYNLPSTDSVSQEIGASFSSRVMQTVNRVIEVPLNINGREVARATAWDMGEQLAWESR